MCLKVGRDGRRCPPFLRTFASFTNGMAFQSTDENQYTEVSRGLCGMGDALCLAKTLFHALASCVDADGRGGRRVTGDASRTVARPFCGRLFQRGAGAADTG